MRVLGRSAGIHEEKLHDLQSAIEKNEAILGIDGGNIPAVKNLERLYRAEAMWDRLISVMQHHVGLIQDRREQVALEVAIGEVFWKELSRVDRAESIFNHALQLNPDSREAVSALGRLYERSGNWNLALDMLRREARIAGGAKDAVEIHVRMGAIFEDMLLDTKGAKEAYGRALQSDPGHLGAIRALKSIAERDRDRDRYLELLVDEARYATEPAEKTERYTEAARIYQEERDNRENAARYYEEALKRTPGHLEAGRPLSDIYIAQLRWPEAERVLVAVVEGLIWEGIQGAIRPVLPARLRLGEAGQRTRRCRPIGGPTARLHLPAGPGGAGKPPREGGAVGGGAPHLHHRAHPPPRRPHRHGGGGDALANRRDRREAGAGGPRQTPSRRRWRSTTTTSRREGAWRDSSRPRTTWREWWSSGSGSCRCSRGGRSSTTTWPSARPAETD